MRQVIGGNGADTTAETYNFLTSSKVLLIRHLVLIGEIEDPRAIWLTDHEAPLIWSYLVGQGGVGVFTPGVFKRGMVTSKTGLDSSTMDFTWSPSLAKQVFTGNTGTASPLQLARQHIYDNWKIRIWRAFMPTPGDCNTLGACQWWGGRVTNCDVQRGSVVFHCADFLSACTQKVPSTVIELTNTLASTAAVTLPATPPGLPVFSCVTGSTENLILADCTAPNPDNIYAGNIFAGGYMVFLSGPGATLAGNWSAIGQNGKFTDGNGDVHSNFTIYAPLPFPPTPGVDTFYVSMAAPVNVSGEGNFGFPFVPNPASAA
jgi:hypothetical protein